MRVVDILLSSEWMQYHYRPSFLVGIIKNLPISKRIFFVQFYRLILEERKYYLGLILYKELKLMSGEKNGAELSSHCAGSCAYPDMQKYFYCIFIHLVFSTMACFHTDAVPELTSSFVPSTTFSRLVKQWSVLFPQECSSAFAASTHWEIHFPPSFHNLSLIT